MLQAKARLATTQAHWRGVGDSCNHAYSGVSASILLKLFRHPAWNVRASPNFKALRSFSCLRVGPSPNSERAFSYSVHLASVVVLERLVPATLRWSQSRQTLLPALQEEDTSSLTLAMVHPCIYRAGPKSTRRCAGYSRKLPTNRSVAARVMTARQTGEHRRLELIPSRQEPEILNSYQSLHSRASIHRLSLVPSSQWLRASYYTELLCFEDVGSLPTVYHSALF